MLLRWDLENPGQTVPFPTPRPGWDGVAYLPSKSLPLARAGVGFGPENAWRFQELVIEAAEYSQSQGWRLRGRVTRPAGQPTVRAILGGSGNGTTIGQARVTPDGAFLIRNSTGARPPANVSQVSFTTSDGGTQFGVPFTRLP